MNTTIATTKHRFRLPTYQLPVSDDYLPWRASATIALIIGILAYRQSGQIDSIEAAIAIIVTALALPLSWRLRLHRLVGLRTAVSLLMLSVFIWLALRVFAAIDDSDASAALSLLALLTMLVLIINMLTVIRSREVGFCIAGSGLLITISSLEAYNYSFLLYIVLWTLVVVIGARSLWSHRYGATMIYNASLIPLAILGVASILFLVAVVPLPNSTHTDLFPSLDPNPVDATGNPLSTGDAGSAKSTPYHIGGYAGFSDQLDTALRGPLGDKVIYRVRATVPTYWINTTYNQWNGESWFDTIINQKEATARITHLPGESWVYLDTPSNVEGQNLSLLPPYTTDVQTFYPSTSVPNVILHADNPTQLYFPARYTYSSPLASTIITNLALQQGTAYTVISQIATPSAATLRKIGTPTVYKHLLATSSFSVAPYLQLPKPYTRVYALARHITANARGNYYLEAEDIMSWMHRHTKYSLAIPPLPPGADAVDSFLFGTRVGFCEQISTAMVVMLRTLGVPSREVSGYIPGSYNAITGMYTVQAKDAHAWAQIYFPGHGWITFDPTAVVPLAAPSTASTLTHELGHAAHDWRYALAGLTAALLLYGIYRGTEAWTHRPRTIPQKIKHMLRAKGETAGVIWEPYMSLRQYAEAVRPYVTPLDYEHLDLVVSKVEAYLYGGDRRPLSPRLLEELSIIDIRRPGSSGQSITLLERYRRICARS